MFDLISAIALAAIFALGFAYIRACERLKGMRP